MAGDVITTGASAAETVRTEAPQDTDPIAPAEQAEAAAANVAGSHEPGQAAVEVADPAAPDAVGPAPDHFASGSHASPSPAPATVEDAAAASPAATNTPGSPAATDTPGQIGRASWRERV